MGKKFKLFSQLARVYHVFTQVARYLQKIPTSEFDPLNPSSLNGGPLNGKSIVTQSVVVKYGSD